METGGGTEQVSDLELLEPMGPLMSRQVQRLSFTGDTPSLSTKYRTVSVTINRPSVSSKETLD